MAVSRSLVGWTVATMALFIPVAATAQVALPTGVGTKFEEQEVRSERQDFTLLLPARYVGGKVAWDRKDPWVKNWIKPRKQHESSYMVFGVLPDADDGDLLSDVQLWSGAANNPERLAEIEHKYGAERTALLLVDEEQQTISVSLWDEGYLIEVVEEPAAFTTDMEMVIAVAATILDGLLGEQTEQELIAENADQDPAPPGAQYPDNQGSQVRIDLSLGNRTWPEMERQLQKVPGLLLKQATMVGDIMQLDVIWYGDTADNLIGELSRVGLVASWE